MDTYTVHGGNSSMNQVNLPQSVQDPISRFRREGTMGPGALRTQLGQDAAPALGNMVRDLVRVTALDQKRGDEDPAPGRLDAGPEVASTVAPRSFGPVARLVGSFEGRAEDPDAATLHFQGPNPNRHKFIVMESCLPDGGVNGGQVTFYEATSNQGHGLIRASRFEIDGGQIRGYTEMLTVPWHLAK
ncbi:MAG: hypothetical protein AB1758_00290 [Candidatus Eremiobacterota bacterium]